jgi:hypothetical protein
MSSEMTWFFDELDGYVKTQYRCFVAEMFLSEAQDEHIVCFRPVDVIRDSPDQFACRYLRISVGEVNAAQREKRLTDSITEKLKQLKALE